MISVSKSNGLLFACTAIGLALAANAASAQEAAENGGLEEIIVTAQKREQSLQDVPISVTALSEDTLQANRVFSVTDLTGLAPGVTVRTAAGGSKLPSFSIRGAISYGVVPGSDKQVSMYVDGVYISSARGGIFELPDVQRIEVLRGPQGTLFGRNATAGAVSVSTRDPSGELRFKQEVTVGNYDQFRSRTSVDLPKFGPFSAYVTYVHDYKRGDIRNLGAGQVWDRTATGLGVATSPKYLGTRKSDSIFAAVKFESGDFTTVYKYDYSKDNGTPEGTGFVGLNTAAPGIGVIAGPLVNALLTANVPIAADGKRPEAVYNSWLIPTRQKTFGHNLTSTLRLSDNLSIRNIFAYRQSYLFATSSIDGLSALPLTQAAVVPLATFQVVAGGLSTALIPTLAAGLQARIGQPVTIVATQPESLGKQWSDELQVNYDSALLTLTLGGLWFHSTDVAGRDGLANSSSFSVIPNGVIGLTRGAKNHNRATSLAAYAQAEIHVTPQLDLVLGGRVTADRKSGELVYGTPPSFSSLPFTYRRTKPNWLAGVNYKPDDDTLLYAKFSTAFVSGGSVSGRDFAPETATSYEAGIKADLFDRQLRANLAVYHVTYKHFQTAQSATNFPDLFPAGLASVIGTFILDQGGPVKAKGFELEVTAAPARGLTVGGSLGYNDTQFFDVNLILIQRAGGDYQPALRSKWTGGLWGAYQTEPLFGDAYGMLRIDSTFHSRFNLNQNPGQNIAAFAGIHHVDASWTVNARAALRDVNIGGAKVEIAAWVKNLTQNREASFSGQTLQLVGGANYVPARTFGADLIFGF